MRMIAQLISIICLATIMPRAGWACACGCGIFDVGTGTMIPTGKGGVVWFEYDRMNQNHNWRGTSSAPGIDNRDKQIATDFFTLGVQYMFNRFLSPDRRFRLPAQSFKNPRCAISFSGLL